MTTSDRAKILLGRPNESAMGLARAAETIVQVVGFVDPAWRIEVEVDAVIADAT